MNDLKLALRQLPRNPDFTAVAVLTLALTLALALGIGTDTASLKEVPKVMSIL